MCSNSTDTIDTEQKRRQICLALDVSEDTTWEDLCEEIDNASWYRNRAIDLGLPLNSTPAEISQALEEDSRRERQQRLGISADASKEEIDAAEREYERAARAELEELPSSSTWQEIAETLWRELNSLPKPTYEPPKVSKATEAALTVMMMVCGLLLLVPAPFPLRLCFAAATALAAGLLLRPR